MYWGLKMKPNNRYTQTVEIPFHLSMATLDIATADNELVQVMVCYNSTNYLLCNLQKDSVWQVLLNLNFQKGIEITFTCNGRSNVYLAGYLIPDEDNMIEEEKEVEEEEDKKDDNYYTASEVWKRITKKVNKIIYQRRLKKKQNKRKLYIKNYVKNYGRLFVKKL